LELIEINGVLTPDKELQQIMNKMVNRDRRVMSPDERKARQIKIKQFMTNNKYLKDQT